MDFFGWKDFRRDIFMQEEGLNSKVYVWAIGLFLGPVLVLKD